ncbi:CLUMA_CG018556, isoform A [Clunio marinus]|uniref:CLUMA_CG018556, isoform A n=1 Tax=Clunio marinus TaxID=568069 RepID=A0A1J1IZH7_9DIPT|nr:CLUMA_CG018556, isoform A [Clunio marinus]
MLVADLPMNYRTIKKKVQQQRIYSAILTLCYVDSKSKVLPQFHGFHGFRRKSFSKDLKFVQTRFLPFQFSMPLQVEQFSFTSNTLEVLITSFSSDCFKKF